MNFSKLIVFAFVCMTVFLLLSTAQKISYMNRNGKIPAEPNFEIIGRVGGNILVYKNNRSNNFISVYDNEMKLVERVHLDYIDETMDQC